MWIDVSVPLDGPVPAWPGSPGVSVTSLRSFEDGDASQDTVLTLDVHCGTHVECPAHVTPGGVALQSTAPDQLVGTVVVIDAGDATEVPASLAQVVPNDVDGVFVRTTNSVKGLMSDPVFREDFVGWSTRFANELAKRSHVKFAGADYLSVQPFGGDPSVHRTLLDAGITIVEGLDLAQVSPGRYEILGLFLSLPSREAAPARVLIRGRSEGVPS